MTGKITKTFPKLGAKGTYIILIRPNDDSPDIYEEMNGVTDKDELPQIGTVVELEKGFPTWKVKW